MQRPEKRPLSALTPRSTPRTQYRLNIDPRTKYRLSHPCLRTLLPQCVSAYSDPGRTLYLSDEPVQSPVSSMYPFMVVSAARRRIILTPHNHSAIKGPKLVRTS